MLKNLAHQNIGTQTGTTQLTSFLEFEYLQGLTSVKMPHLIRLNFVKSRKIVFFQQIVNRRADVSLNHYTSNRLGHVDQVTTSIGFPVKATFWVSVHLQSLDIA